MLGKLLKYDLKYNCKVLVIFYALAIFFAALTRIFGGIGSCSFSPIISSPTSLKSGIESKESNADSNVPSIIIKFFLPASESVSKHSCSDKKVG